MSGARSYDNVIFISLKQWLRLFDSCNRTKISIPVQKSTKGFWMELEEDCSVKDKTLEKFVPRWLFTN